MSDSSALNAFVLTQVKQGTLNKQSALQLLKIINSDCSRDELEMELLGFSYRDPATRIVVEHLLEIREKSRGGEEPPHLSSYLVGTPVLEWIPKGMMDSNCYLVGHNGEAAVIDPGSDFEPIWNAIQRADVRVKYIIITHTHIDHMVSFEKLREATGAQVIMHAKDKPGLKDSVYNGSMVLAAPSIFGPADLFAEEGDVFEVGGLKLKMLYTPGHTQGSLCVEAGGCIFVGDLLFYEELGEPGPHSEGNYSDLMRSYKRILAYPEQTVLFPGHGRPTTVKHECTIIREKELA